MRTVSYALGDVAAGLDGLSETLDSGGMAQMGAGLGATADYLEGKVALRADVLDLLLGKAAETDHVGSDDVHVAHGSSPFAQLAGRKK